ncbi:hypothetical protein [Qipengyuania sp. ASV99]|uniref:hypothetical protein n=1 Tax=Qipengyuania sp. ASV99 TaxID=3399681 RepID=UPI003A4C6FB2
MNRNRRPFLLIALLLSIGLRTVFGAPCCMSPVQAAEHAPLAQVSAEKSHRAHLADLRGPDAQAGEAEGHAGHGDNPTAKPCCSACGPTLPSEPVLFTKRAVLLEMPPPAAVRALVTHPTFTAYEATGPPLLI